MSIHPPTWPILDPGVARDTLLDARSLLVTVQVSTFPGADLYEYLQTALMAIDDAMCGLPRESL